MDLGDRSSGTDLPGGLAPRVGLEPTTLRLTDAGRCLLGPDNVGVRCSLGSARVQQRAARCGQNCGQEMATDPIDR